MNEHISSVPILVSVIFVLTFLTPIALITKSIVDTFSPIDSKLAHRLKRQIWIFYGLFFLLVSSVALSGFFMVNVLPPRILIFVSVPLLVCYFIIWKSSSWFKKYVDLVSFRSLVSVHLFRFIGIFFLIALYYQALPEKFAWIGGLGDILTAVLALIFILYVHRRRKSFSYLWLFNLVGIIDICSVLVTAVLATKEAITTETMGVGQFGSFPFVWIPAFAPATILFLHFITIWKLVGAGSKK